MCTKKTSLRRVFSFSVLASTDLYQRPKASFIDHDANRQEEDDDWEPGMLSVFFSGGWFARRFEVTPSHRIHVWYIYLHWTRVLVNIPSLKLTFSPLKMDGWNTTFLLGRPIFRGELLVSGRVHPCNFSWTPNMDIFESQLLSNIPKNPSSLLRVHNMQIRCKKM